MAAGGGGREGQEEEEEVKDWEPIPAITWVLAGQGSIAHRERYNVEVPCFGPGLRLDEPRAFFINLDRRPDRARRLRALLRGAPELRRRLQRVPAVDGRALDQEALVRGGLLRSALRRVRGSSLLAQLDWSQLTSGALGCALSHLALWRRLAAARPPPAWSLVLEDDLFAIAPDLDERLPAVVASLPSDWDICFVGFHSQAAFEFLLSRALPSSTLARAERVEVRQGRSEWDLLGPRLGTFGYLVSAKGVERLLERGVIFPLQRQLDQQLNHAIAQGDLKAWALPADAALVHSPPFRCADSDVQTPWGPEDGVEEAWRGQGERLQAAARRRFAELEREAEGLPAGPWPCADCASFLDLQPAASRRCVAYTVMGDAWPSPGHALSHLHASVASLRVSGSDVPVLALWYGSDRLAAAAAGALLEESFRDAVVVYRGAFEDVVEEFLPEEDVGRLAHLPELVSLGFFQPFLLDQLLIVDVRTRFAKDAAQLFALHSERDVYMQPWPSLPTDSQQDAEEALPHCSLYNAEAWLRLGPWLGSALQFRGELAEKAPGLGKERLDCLASAAAFRRAGLCTDCLSAQGLSAAPAEVVHPSPAPLAAPSSLASGDEGGLGSAEELLLSLTFHLPPELLGALDWAGGTELLRG